MGEDRGIYQEEVLLLGQRAVLIIAENEKYEIYYDHWCANTLDSYLFWGPEEAVSFIRKHDPEKGYWLNDVWCEGAVLVDLDKKKLLFFGGEDITYEIPLRRVYLELLAEMWKGYEINWAYHGITDLARYAGYDWKSLMDKSKREECKIINSFDSDSGGFYITGVFSITDKNNIRKVFPLYSYDNRLIFCDNEKIIEYVNKLGDRSKVFEEERHKDYTFPSYGMHIDMTSKTSFFWESDTTNADYYDNLENLWDGWEIQYFYDDYQKHAELIENEHIFPEIDHRKCVDRIRNIVCGENNNPADTVKDIVDALKNSGKEKIEINPAVYAADSFDMPKDSRVDIFEKISAEYLKKIRKK